MPQQKALAATDPFGMRFLFALGDALVQDGWGVTLQGNVEGATLTTNAPSNILMHYSEQYADVAQPQI